MVITAAIADKVMYTVARRDEEPEEDPWCMITKDMTIKIDVIGPMLGGQGGATPLIAATMGRVPAPPTA
jgi:hypothetical protein